MVPPRRRAGACRRHRSLEAIGRVMGARRSAWLTSRLHARRVVKRLPSKSTRSDAGDCFRSLRFLQAAIHVLDAEAKKRCVLAVVVQGRGAAR